MERARGHLRVGEAKIGAHSAERRQQTGLMALRLSHGVWPTGPGVIDRR